MKSYFHIILWITRIDLSGLGWTFRGFFPFISPSQNYDLEGWTSGESSFGTVPPDIDKTAQTTLGFQPR
jgi:hypothetical protein